MQIFFYYSELYLEDIESLSENFSSQINTRWSWQIAFLGINNIGFERSRTADSVESLADFVILREFADVNGELLLGSYVVQYFPCTFLIRINAGTEITEMGSDKSSDYKKKKRSLEFFSKNSNEKKNG